jgi:hypothetical protein
LPKPLTKIASKVISVANSGRPSAETKVRKTLLRIEGIIANISTARNPPARAEIAGSWPVNSMIRSPARHTAMPPSPTSTASHSAIRTERRTSRTAWLRRPSSAAISGAQAAVRAEKHHIISPNSEIDRLEAASACSPSRATKITSSA